MQEPAKSLRGEADFTVVPSQRITPGEPLELTRHGGWFALRCSICQRIARGTGQIMGFLFWLGDGWLTMDSFGDRQEPAPRGRGNFKEIWMVPDRVGEYAYLACRRDHVFSVPGPWLIEQGEIAKLTDYADITIPRRFRGLKQPLRATRVQQTTNGHP